MSEPIFKDNADSYRAIGLIVLPAIRGEKRPIVSWKQYQTGVSDDVHNRWKEEFSAANIGLVTGKTTGILTLDMDSDAAVERFEKEICPLNDILTPAVKTPHGRHVHFKYPAFEVRNGVNVLGKNSGVDIRGEGGFAVLPPSQLSDGGVYRWMEGRDPRSGVPFAALPEAFLKFLKSRNGFGRREFEIEDVVNGVSMGARNQAAAELAGHFFGLGSDYETVLKSLLQWNLRNTPPLSEAEIRGVVRSIQNRDLAKRRWSKDHGDAADPHKSGQINFQITQIEKVDTDPAVYYVHVFDKRIVMGAKELMSFSSFRTRVMEAANRVVTFPNVKQWPFFIDHLLKTKLTITQTPDEITFNTHVIEEIARYVDEHGSQNTKLIRSNAGAYLQEEMVYLPTKFFRELAKELDVRVGQIWERVRELGGTSRVVRLPIDDEEDKTKVLRVWILPMKALAVHEDHPPQAAQTTANGSGGNGFTGELPL